MVAGSAAVVVFDRAIGTTVDFTAAILSAAYGLAPVGRGPARVGRGLLRGASVPAFGQIDGLVAHANQPCSIQPSAAPAGRKAQAR